MLFLPMWLLGDGGPPREVMSSPMVAVADLLPLTHATAAIREPWIFHTAPAGADLLALAACSPSRRSPAGSCCAGCLVHARGDR